MTITIQPDQIDAPQINVATTTTTTTLTLGSTVINGLENWVHVSANTTMSANTNYFANTQANTLTLTLPASASIGDSIQIVDVAGYAANNNLTVNCNSHNIDGALRNAILNVNRGGVRLVYQSTQEGWTSRKREKQVRNLMGEIAGFASGGTNAPGTTSILEISRFSFATDVNSDDVGDLTEKHYYGSSTSSSTHGYAAGGEAPPGANSDKIEKFPMVSAAGTITDVGNLSATAVWGHAGVSSFTDGYALGGYPDGGSAQDIIQKYPFASDGNAVAQTGTLTEAVARSTQGTGISSFTDGYRTAGYDAPNARVTTIDKFPFASDTGATDIGDAAAGNLDLSNSFSEINGYIAGGALAPGRTNAIDKFPLASGGTAANIGTLNNSTSTIVGMSSQDNGYATGGATAPTTNINVIDKYPFATDSNASDVGDLNTTKRGHTGQQI